MKSMKESFRPQQGLPIMNNKLKTYYVGKTGFRPQQGLPIMNYNRGYRV